MSGCEENTWEAAAVDQERDGGTGAAPVAAEKRTGLNDVWSDIVIIWELISEGDVMDDALVSGLTDWKDTRVAP